MKTWYSTLAVYTSRVMILCDEYVWRHVPVSASLLVVGHWQTSFGNLYCTAASTFRGEGAARGSTAPIIAVDSCEELLSCGHIAVENRCEDWTKRVEGLQTPRGAKASTIRTGYEFWSLVRVLLYRCPHVSRVKQHLDTHRPMVATLCTLVWCSTDVELRHMVSSVPGISYSTGIILFYV
ncbi:unnamed protein product [Laminaria digitata]